MKVYFEITSYELKNKKWVSRYNKITKNGEKVIMQEFTFKNQFSNKKEADEYAKNYCLKRGYLFES